MKNLTTKEKKMIENIESHNGREVEKKILDYDRETLKSLIKNELVAVIGKNKISRKYYKKLA